MLAQREHSRAELREKLARQTAPELLERVLDDLCARGLLNDRRFVEQYLSSHIRKGYGPLQLRHDLSRKGIDVDQIEQVLAELEVDWAEQLRQVHDKKYGPEPPGDYKEAARRARFLAQRGFPEHLIRKLLK